MKEAGDSEVLVSMTWTNYVQADNNCMNEMPPNHLHSPLDIATPVPRALAAMSRVQSSTACAKCISYSS